MMHRSVVRTLVPLFATSLVLSACGDQTVAQPAGPGATAGSGGSAGSGGAGGSGGSGGAGGALDPRFLPFMAAVEEERVKLGAPGVAVAIVENGEVTFAMGFGSKDPDGAEPVLPTTLFRLASVTKMMTATALLQDVAAGAVDLEAAIPTYVPGFHFETNPNFDVDPTWEPAMQVGHLLTHSSGMSDWLKVNVGTASKSDDALHDYIVGGAFPSMDYLMAPPGAFWNYSNPNFYVAGLVSETLAGKPYRALMNDRVFAPLGMTRTFFLPEDVLADGDYAIGMNTAFQGIAEKVAPDTYDNGWARPCGYAFSNVLDLAKFTIFLMDGNDAVLPKAQREAMQSPQINLLTYGDLYWYGFGLFVDEGACSDVQCKHFHATRAVSHGGALPGFATEVYYLPSLRFGIITLANTDGAYFYESMATALQTLVTLPPETSVPDFGPDPATFDSLAGVYHDERGGMGDVVVTSEADGVHVVVPGWDQLAVPYTPLLAPASLNDFLLTVQGYPLEVTFIADDSGTMKYLRTRGAVGIRVPGPPPPPSGASATPIDPAVAAVRRAELLERLTQPQMERPIRPVRMR